MSLLLISTTVIEFIIIAAILVVLGMVRKILSTAPSSRSLKVRKYVGFVIVGILFIAVMDYSYTAYRYFYPAGPYGLIEFQPDPTLKTLDNCQKPIVH